MKRVKVVITAEAVVPDHIAKRAVDNYGGPRDKKLLAQMIIESDKSPSIVATYEDPPKGERF